MTTTPDGILPHPSPAMRAVDLEQLRLILDRLPTTWYPIDPPEILPPHVIIPRREDALARLREIEQMHIILMSEAQLIAREHGLCPDSSSTTPTATEKSSYHL